MLNKKLLGGNLTCTLKFSMVLKVVNISKIL